MCIPIFLLHQASLAIVSGRFPMLYRRNDSTSQPSGAERFPSSIPMSVHKVPGPGWPLCSLFWYATLNSLLEPRSSSVWMSPHNKDSGAHEVLQHPAGGTWDYSCTLCFCGPLLRLFKAPLIFPRFALSVQRSYLAAAVGRDPQCWLSFSLPQVISSDPCPLHTCWSCLQTPTLPFTLPTTIYEVAVNYC